MSDRPKIGSSGHAGAFPNRLSLYNVNYDTVLPYEKISDFAKPWWVDRGWDNLKAFTTFEEGLGYMLKLMKVNK
jgi:hypothetical protein